MRAILFRNIRQINITGHGKIKPAIIITNDFDLVMSILAHNLYRLFALDMKRYSHLSDINIYEKFIDNSATVSIGNEQIKVELKKKRALPQILELFGSNNEIEYDWIGNKSIEFPGASTS